MLYRSGSVVQAMVTHPPGPMHGAAEGDGDVDREPRRGARVVPPPEQRLRGAVGAGPPAVAMALRIAEESRNSAGVCLLTPLPV